MKRIVENAPDLQSTKTNFVHVNHKEVYASFVQIGTFIFNVVGHDYINSGAIGLGSIKRKILRVAMGDEVGVNFVNNVSLKDAKSIHCKIYNFRSSSVKLDPKILSERLKQFSGQVFIPCQQIAFDLKDNYYILTINLVNDKDLSGAFIRDDTVFIVDEQIDDELNAMYMAFERICNVSPRSEILNDAFEVLKLKHPGVDMVRFTSFINKCKEEWA